MFQRRAIAAIICWSVFVGLASILPGGSVRAAQPAMHLEFVEELAGPILDVAQDRILYVDYSDGTPRVTIKDRASGTETVIGDGPATGFLAPGGAIYIQTTNLYGRVFHYADDARTDLGDANSSVSLRVAGRWAIWNSAPTYPTPLIVRDLVSGEQRVVAEDAGNWQNDVAENGDIVFWDRQYNVKRDRGGQLEILSPADPTTWVTYPRTDGVNVIYRKTSICCSNERGGIWLMTRSGEIDLDAFRTEWPIADADYAVNDGWAAFTRPKVGGGFTVWSRDPDGLIESRDIEVNAEIAAIGTGGQILMRERRTDGQRLFLSPAGGEVIPLGSVPGLLTGFWEIGADWYVVSAGHRSAPEAPPAPDRLYIVAAGAAPTPTPSESATAPAPTPTPGESATAPEPTSSDAHASPADLTLPPTDGVRVSGRGSPSSVVLGMTMAVLGSVGLAVIATASRARARRR